MSTGARGPGRVRAGWAFLALLVGFSFYLAAHRMFQVDEVQNVYMARILGQGWQGIASTAAPLHLLGPMTWLGRALPGSGEFLVASRLVFTGVFWANVALLPVACGLRLRSPEGLCCLLLGATLAPLWDYGFEVRHDNVLLLAILLLWILARRAVRLSPPLRYGGMGILSALAQFTAYKAFLYWLPLAVLALWLVDGGWGARRKALLWGAAGLLAGFALGRLAHALAGTWPLYVADFQGGTAASARVERFSPLPALGRLLLQAPLLAGGLLAFGMAVYRDLRRPPFAATLAHERMPELLFLLAAFAAFLANPTPFPYNLLFVVPPGFIAAMTLRDAWGKGLRRAPLLLPVLGAAQVLTWWAATSRHLDMTNDRQLDLAAAAESLTDPAKDGVFDGSGLVNARRPIGFRWLIHTFTIQGFSDGRFPAIRTSLAQNPSPVFIPNYRTDWIPAEDQRFVRAHYLPLADDFWVLGGQVPEGGGAWTCLHGGRYLLRPVAGGGEVEVDGVRRKPGPLQLEQGVHAIRAADGAAVWVVWLGPTRMEPPALSPGDHRRVFVNWY